jgi:hypothetical protein
MDAAQGGLVPSLPYRWRNGLPEIKEGRLNMKAYATTEIRELTAQELDHVAGGSRFIADPVDHPGMFAAQSWTYGAVLGVLIGGLLDWLGL